MGEKIRVYRYSFWNEFAKVRFVSDTFATLETIDKGLGKPVYSKSKRVPIQEVVGGMWRAPFKAGPR